MLILLGKIMLLYFLLIHNRFHKKFIVVFKIREIIHFTSALKNLFDITYIYFYSTGQNYQCSKDYILVLNKTPHASASLGQNKQNNNNNTKYRWCKGYVNSWAQQSPVMWHVVDVSLCSDKRGGCPEPRGSSGHPDQRGQHQHLSATGTTRHRGETLSAL